MVQEINGLFRMTGDEELLIPKFESELELLREIKEEIAVWDAGSGTRVTVHTAKAPAVEGAA